jgi:hypothetical protein
MEVQKIPAGKTAINDPNKMFSLTMRAAAIRREALKSEQKYLPKPKRSK